MRFEMIIKAMKNLFLHYLAMVIPLLILILSWRYVHYPSLWFIGLFFLWCFVYHPYLTGRRLYVKGLIPKRRLVYGLHLHPDWFKKVYFER